MGLKTFLIEPTGRALVYLRRYTRSGDGWTCAEGWHQAKVAIEPGRTEPDPTYEREGIVRLAGYLRPDGTPTSGASGDEWPHDDPRWPAHCEKGCGYAFTDADTWQLHWNAEYSGGEWTGALNEAPPGAMWNADWMGEHARGADGRCLVAKLPNGWEWMIDAPASNCTLKDDSAHRCWVRHGTPPVLTVDKAAGTADASAPTTCAAGAGSIQGGDWHGFLRGGEFVLA